MSAWRRRNHLPLAATLIVLAGCSLAGCGNSSNDSKLLSATSASELRSTLAEVQQTVQNGDCGAAQDQVNLLESQVNSLGRVEADLRDALTSGVSRLQQLVIEKCQTAAAETGTTGPAETGGTTAPDEQQSDEQGNGKKNKDKKNKTKDQSGDEAGGGQQDEGGTGGGESGGSGDGGTTGSGGFAP